MDESVWEFGGITVHYSPDLDGEGTSMAAGFVDFLRQRYASEIPFERALEWCAGPGFIGFALLAAGICRSLVLAEINPRAVAAALRTIDSNVLHDRVTVVLGDNLSGLTAGRFDLVVSNPPNFYCLNPQHPAYQRLKEDLRPNDPGWKLHQRFYAEIPRFLNAGALLCIEEVDPFAEKCFLPNRGIDRPVSGPEPFDLRPRPPIDDFIDMIELAGLNYHSTARLPHPEFPVHLVLSRFEPRKPSIRLRADVTVFERLGDPVDGKYRICGLRHGRELGQMELVDDGLWVMDLLERLTCRRGEPQTAYELGRELGVAEPLLRNALDALRGMGWLHAPAGCL